MKVKKIRSYSKYTKEAALLLGQLIQLARKEKSWSEIELAERAGINKLTLRKIEKGDLNTAMGLVFEVATLVGIQLFDSGPSRLTSNLERVEDKLALLPKRIRKPTSGGVNDDF